MPGRVREARRVAALSPPRPSTGLAAAHTARPSHAASFGAEARGSRPLARASRAVVPMGADLPRPGPTRPRQVETSLRASALSTGKYREQTLREHRRPQRPPAVPASCPPLPSQRQGGARTQQRFGVGQAQLHNRVVQDGPEERAVGVDALVQLLGGGLPVPQQPLALRRQERQAAVSSLCAHQRRPTRCCPRRTGRQREGRAGLVFGHALHCGSMRQRRPVHSRNGGRRHLPAARGRGLRSAQAQGLTEALHAHCGVGRVWRSRGHLSSLCDHRLSEPHGDAAAASVCSQDGARPRRSSKQVNKRHTRKRCAFPRKPKPGASRRSGVTALEPPAARFHRTGGRGGRPGTHGGALLVVAHSEGVHHFLFVEAHLHQGHDGLREGTQSLSATRGPRGPPRSQAAPAWSLRGSRGCFDTDPPGRPSPAASSQHDRNASGFLNQPRGEAFSRAALARGPRTRGLQDLGLCSSAHAPFTVPSTAGKGGGQRSKTPTSLQ